MSLRIRLMVPGYVTVVVKSFRWLDPVPPDAVVCDFKCSGCGNRLGQRSGYGWVVIPQQDESDTPIKQYDMPVRLCEICGQIAAQDLLKSQ